MNRIKELRILRNISMRDAAAQIGIPYTTYVNYEKGAREPNSEMLILLADFFGVTIDYMLCRTDVNEENTIIKFNLAPDEQQLIQDYRRLSAEGKEKIREQMAMHISFYAEKNPSFSDLEGAV